MFDTTCSNRGEWESAGFACGEPECPALDKCMRIGAIVWEEHCVECGQPECFKTCRMYERAYDGKCRRFESGIVPLKVGNRVMHGCAFRKWSKLEGRFTGGVSTFGLACRVAALDRFLAKIAQMINRIMAFVPGRIGAITIYRRLKLWMSNVKNHTSKLTVNGLILRCCASRAVKLHFAVIMGEECVCDAEFDLKGGWQTFETTFRAVSKGARFLLFSTDEKPFRLIVDALELLPNMMSQSTNAAVAAPLTKGEPAKFVKCLAWDLDNTLWKGTLVEDGLEKLVLNKDAVSLIKTLDARGIINTIVSKNDYTPAWNALEHFGLSEYFVFPMISWMPKSANLMTAAKTINIGLDSFAFVDDSPFERGEVGEKLPMVRVFKNTEIGALADRAEFNPVVSGEGAKRRLSYQKEMQRVKAAQAFVGDYDAFLRSCKIVLTMFPLNGITASEKDRCYELVQRTNQLTLAGRRYTEEQFATLISGEGVEAWGVRCQDKFGDYGIVGVAVSRHNGDVCVVDEFVMSCRVAKKQCEYGVVHALAMRAKEQGARALKTRLVKTGRNGALVAAFDEMPFAKSVLEDGKAMDCELNLMQAVLPHAVNEVRFQ